MCIFYILFCLMLKHVINLNFIFSLLMQLLVKTFLVHKFPRSIDDIKFSILYFTYRSSQLCASDE